MDAAIQELIAYVQRVYACHMREDGQWVATTVLHGRSASKQVLLLSSPRRQPLLTITAAPNGGTLLRFALVPRWSEGANQTVLAKKAARATVTPSASGGVALRVAGRGGREEEGDLVRALVRGGLLLDDDSE